MIRALAALLASLAFSGAAADPETPIAKPKVYALVAAMGNQLMATHEVRRTGSRLPPWRHTRIDDPDNALNRLVLSGLDEAVGKIEPGSQRVHLGIAVRRARTETAPLDEVAFAAALTALQAMPEHGAWDRIIIATPAYRALNADGMPARSQGFGVFMQPLCQSQKGTCGMWGDGSSAVAAEKVQTPDGKEITANQFVAPYVFLKIWIVDPRTLTVTDSQEVFDYQKLWDPAADTMDLSQVIPKRVLATRIVELASHATEEAVTRSELRGKVDVKERGPVPDDSSSPAR